MIRYESTPPDDTDGAAYQSWLRRHIAKLERMQALRIESRDVTLRRLDATIERAEREIDNLKAQQTIKPVEAEVKNVCQEILTSNETENTLARANAQDILKILDGENQ